MLKGFKKSAGKKDKTGSSPKHSKDHLHGSSPENDVSIPTVQSEPPPVPEGPPPSQPPGTLLDKAWRTLEWNKRKHMKDELRKFKLSVSDVAKLRILVHGPVGAGKSSFINSIDSIFQERMTSGTIADAVTGHSFTKTLQTHFIKDQSYGSFLPFAFCDIMGLEAGQCEGVETDDLIKVLKGHIKDGYMFNPVSSCSENHPSYNNSPKLGDRIHCLISVIPASLVSMMDDNVFRKMNAVRKKAGGIPQVAVLTKVDETCPKVSDDIKQVYRSKKIREKMQECSNKLGIPMNCIFPVKCYHEEISLNNDVDVLLMSALTTILHFANDHVDVLANATANMAPPPANAEDSSKRYMNTKSVPKLPPRPPVPR